MTAQQHGACSEPREGKKVYRGSIMAPMRGLKKPVRMVFEVIERQSTNAVQMVDVLVGSIPSQIHCTTAIKMT